MIVTKLEAIIIMQEKAPYIWIICVMKIFQLIETFTFFFNKTTYLRNLSHALHNSSNHPIAPSRIDRPLLFQSTMIMQFITDAYAALLPCRYRYVSRSTMQTRIIWNTHFNYANVPACDFGAPIKNSQPTDRRLLAALVKTCCWMFLEAWGRCSCQRRESDCPFPLPKHSIQASYILQHLVRSFRGFPHVKSLRTNSADITFVTLFFSSKVDLLMQTLRMFYLNWAIIQLRYFLANRYHIFK